jgi:dienelactone hydrolase
VPFNFGGPQPETRLPLPEDAADAFRYAGSGGWESTRNLARSASDGFLPWVIVGAIAPRPLVYAHEFAWDQQRDPVWARLQRIYAWHDASEQLASTHGRGSVRGQPPESTHCTHIGPEHRVAIHEAFGRWFAIDVQPDDEYSARLPASDLHCWTSEAASELQPRTLGDLLPGLARERQERSWAAIDRLPRDERRELAREAWRRVLGKVEPSSGSDSDEPAPSAWPRIEPREVTMLASARAERTMLEVEPGIHVPVVLLLPESVESTRRPVVLGLAQAGKDAFLQQRSAEICALLTDGVAVCLPDVRGTGESSFGEGRGRGSAATAHSSSEAMLGGTLVGARLRDARGVLRWLRTRDDLDRSRIGVWGDSFTSSLASDMSLHVPRDDDAALPQGPEPLGGLLALLTALFEDDVDAVWIGGGVSEFRTALEHHLALISHDAVVPGIVAIGDVPE